MTIRACDEGLYVPVTSGGIRACDEGLYVPVTRANTYRELESAGSSVKSYDVTRSCSTENQRKLRVVKVGYL